MRKRKSRKEGGTCFDKNDLNTPINIFFFGRDYYPVYWIRGLHGHASYGPGTYTVRAEWRVSAGTAYGWYRVLTELYPP